MSKRKIWTEDEKALLRKLYADTSMEELMKKFNCTKSQVYNQANANGLKKSKAFIAETTRKNQLKQIEAGTHKGFPKGHIPDNKGKKMSAELYEKMRQSGTWYQKGNRPQNYKPVGSTRISIDGYIEIKTKDPRTWEMLHRHNWEKCFGKIPEGYNLVFKNKIRTDTRVENLKLLSHAQLMSKNTIHRYPTEVKDLIRTLSKFKKTIKSHESN